MQHDNEILELLIGIFTDLQESIYYISKEEFLLKLEELENFITKTNKTILKTTKQGRDYSGVLTYLLNHVKGIIEGLEEGILSDDEVVGYLKESVSHIKDSSVYDNHEVILEQGKTIRSLAIDTGLPLNKNAGWSQAYSILKSVTEGEYENQQATLADSQNNLKISLHDLPKVFPNLFSIVVAPIMVVTNSEMKPNNMMSRYGVDYYDCEGYLLLSEQMIMLIDPNKFNQEASTVIDNILKIMSIKSKIKLIKGSQTDIIYNNNTKMRGYWILESEILSAIRDSYNELKVIADWKLSI